MNPWNWSGGENTLIKKGAPRMHLLWDQYRFWLFAGCADRQSATGSAATQPPDVACLRFRRSACGHHPADVAFEDQIPLFGHSGVQADTVQRLADMLNHDMLPVVYTQGSLGASGDLAPSVIYAFRLSGREKWIYPGNTHARQTGFANGRLGTTAFKKVRKGWH